MGKTFQQYREKFQGFYEAVKIGHGQSVLPHRGHGFDHDVTVASFASKIAPDDCTADKTWVAAMIHSSDRLIGREDRAKVEEFMRGLLAKLPSDLFEESELNEIVEAALRHMEKNQPDQSLTQVVLMDADRLANLMPAVIIRSGQFNHTIPALEFKYLECPNPESTYRTPSSVVDDLRGCIEWKDWFQTEKGKELSLPLIQKLEDYLKSIADGYRELGLCGIDL